RSSTRCCATQINISSISSGGPGKSGKFDGKPGGYGEYEKSGTFDTPNPIQGGSKPATRTVRLAASPSAGIGWADRSVSDTNASMDSSSTTASALVAGSFGAKRLSPRPFSRPFSCKTDTAPL